MIVLPCITSLCNSTLHPHLYLQTLAPYQSNVEMAVLQDCMQLLDGARDGLTDLINRPIEKAFLMAVMDMKS